MVRNGFVLATALVFAVTASGCGAKWWGEDAPTAKIIDASSTSSKEGCADAWRILEGSESESERAFECWVSRANELWTQVRGVNQNELTDRELLKVLHSGVITISGNAERTIEKLMAAKDVLGFGPKVTRQKLDRWIEWLRGRRSDIRRLYARLFLGDQHEPMLFSDIETASEIAASFLREAHWQKNTEQLAASFLALVDVPDFELRNGAAQGAEVALNLAGMICPTLSDPLVLKTDELADCVEDLPRHFSASKDLFEFVVNPIREFTPERSQRISRSLDDTLAQVKTWFQNPALRPLDTHLWFDWASAIGAAPPKNFIQSLKFLRRFKEKSNENSIDPTLMIRAFRMFRDFQLTFIHGLQPFVDEANKGVCSNGNVQGWKDCVLSDVSIRNKIPEIDLLLRVKNPRHGLRAAPVDGRLLLTVSLFKAMTEQLFQAFAQPGTNVISADIKDENDELVQLITTSLETYQSLERYLSNLHRKLNSVSVLLADQKTGLDIGGWDIKGFAKLIAMSSHTLVERTPEQKNILEKFLSNLTNNFPASSLFLDRPAVIAIMTAIENLDSYRKVALEAVLDDPYGRDGQSKSEVTRVLDQDSPIPRDKAIKALQDILYRNFPRTAMSCATFGFERSCKIALDEIIPSNEDSGLIRPSDLDIITIVGMAMEGIFDNCDTNSDFILRSELLNGNDELDCGFTKMKDIVQRLMESQILKTSPGDRNRINFLLNAVNSVFITRAAGKVALTKGNKDHLLTNIPLFWLYNDATVGSAYGLFADIANSDRVDAANKMSK